MSLLPGLEIAAFDYLNYAPGFALAAKGWAETVCEGSTPPFLTMGYDNKSIVATLNGPVIGVLVWEPVPHKKEAFIVFGYVEAEYRGKGVYTALYAKVRDMARETGLKRVSGMTAAGNRRMQRLCDKLGRQAVAILYEDVL